VKSHSLTEARDYSIDYYRLPLKSTSVLHSGQFSCLTSQNIMHSWWK